MALIETDAVAALARAARPPRQTSPTCPIRVKGKFFFAGEKKHFVKGVTYGPFPVGSHGAQFPETTIVAKDFALMSAAGIIPSASLRCRRYGCSMRLTRRA